MTQNVRQALKDAEDTIKKLNEAFIESQESIMHELNYILKELEAGRNEEAYKTIQDLRDELYCDIKISREKEKTKIFQIINKKELNTTATNENV